MTHPESHRVNAATAMLARLLAGISMTDTRPPNVGGGELVPDVSLAAITPDYEARSVSTIATIPSGDRYRLTVAWIGDGETDHA